jgi:homospermidine synthase
MVKYLNKVCGVGESIIDISVTITSEGDDLVNVLCSHGTLTLKLVSSTILEIFQDFNSDSNFRTHEVICQIQMEETNTTQAFTTTVTFLNEFIEINLGKNVSTLTPVQ